MKKLLMIFMLAVMTTMVTSCGGGDDEPEAPNQVTGNAEVTAALLSGTWKGVFDGYTGTRDELITMVCSPNNEKELYVQIWWSHYLNMDTQYFTGHGYVTGSKLRLVGKTCRNGQTPTNEYDRTVPIKMSKDKKTIEFEFDIATWILTKR